MSSIYVEPGSSTVHITEENNTLSNLAANLDPCQSAVVTDKLWWGYTDQNGDFHTCAAFVNGQIQITPHYALFEDGDGHLGIKQLQDDGVTWVDTGNRIA
jgi:hypothetical protein